MFTHTYKSVEIVVPERRYQSLLEGWFDNLEEGVVKQAIRQIRWRELHPPLSWFRLVVECECPFKDDVEAYIRFRQQDNVDVIADAACKILNHFSKWIDLNGMDQETTIDDRTARITWSAQEVPTYDPTNLPPQERAQEEMNRQASHFLWLVHVSAQPTDEFVKSTVGTNIPFASAGVLLSGHLRMIRRFPLDFPESPVEKDRLLDNIMEHTADYVILLRLASHYNCRLPLVEHTLTAVEAFLRENAAHLPAWQKEFEFSERDDVELLSEEPFLTSERYEVLDSAFDRYRQALMTALQGRARELTEAINSFLSDLHVPNSPLAPEVDDQGEWWKRGNE